MSSTSKEGKRGPWIVSLLVLLALIGGFFLGRGFSFFPKDQADSSDAGLGWYYTTEARLQVWVSKDQFFIWRDEAPRRLAELPARIKEYTAKHHSNRVDLSSEELTRFEDMVYVLDAFRKSGFTHILLETRSRPMPGSKGE